jgi:hypothetical protein
VKQYNFILYLFQRDGEIKLEKSHNGKKQTLCETPTFKCNTKFVEVKKLKIQA